MKLARQAFAAIAFAAAATPALAATITFDDLTPDVGEHAIADGYEGFQWANFYTLNGAVSYPGSGYDTGTVSHAYVAINGHGEMASFRSTTAFNLDSLYVTKAWENGVTRFEGYVGNVLTYSLDVHATTAGPTFVSFDDWNNLNMVVMSDGDGSLHSVVDNITVSAVPEPGTYAMLLGGLAMLGAVSRRKRQG